MQIASCKPITILLGYLKITELQTEIVFEYLLRVAR